MSKKWMLLFLIIAVLVVNLGFTIGAANAQTSYATYVVQRDDTLGKIAAKYCTSWVVIYDLNRNVIYNPNVIYPGMVLTVPLDCPGGDGGGSGGTGVDSGPRNHARGTYSAPYYTVVWGDTLYSIGLRFGLPWQSIAKANGLAYPYIYAGQRLLIPSGGSSPTPPPNTPVRITFQPGATSASAVGTINQGAPASFILWANAGQTMTVQTVSRGEALVGLVFSALSSLLFGLASEINVLYILVVFVGLLSRVAAPAQDAMMTDILPEPKRQEGFGITRVAFNYAWIVGTALGGSIAPKSFFALFVIDAILSLAVAVILFWTLPETKPSSPHAEHKLESFRETVSGYRFVLRDLAYLAFTLAGMIVLIVYQQQYSSLSVYLRDAQVLSIWEGTTNVLSLDAVRAVSKDDALGAWADDARARLEALRLKEGSTSRCFCRKNVKPATSASADASQNLSPNFEKRKKAFEAHFTAKS